MISSSQEMHNKDKNPFLFNLKKPDLCYVDKMLCTVLFIDSGKEKQCGCGCTVGIKKGIPNIESTLGLYMIWGVDSEWIYIIGILSNLV